MLSFLTLEKEVFGLDISDLSLKIVNLKKRGKSFKVVSFNKIDIQPGLIKGGVIQDEDALAKIITDLCKKARGKKVKTKYVIASLPEEKSFLQVIQMPNMKEEELKSAVGFEAENYIPLPMSEVYLDFQTIAPFKEKPDHLDVLIVAIPKKIVNSYVSCLKKAGLIPVVLEIESEAIARALVKKQTTQTPLVLIDFGKSNTDFIIFSGRSIRFTYSIPISSQELTIAISTSLKIDMKKAEALKLKCDLSKTKKTEEPKKVFEAISPVLEELVLQIKKYLNFYQDHASHEHTGTSEKIENMILCGGGANLKGLPDFLSEKLGLNVELGDFWTNFEVKQPKQAINEDALSFITALGLAQRGIKKIGSVD